MNQTTIDPALLSEDVYPLWCKSARSKATGPHDALPSSIRHTPDPISEDGGQGTLTHIDPSHLPPDVYRLWCGSVRGKATGHQYDPDDDGGLTWQEFSHRETRFLYPRRHVISDPELAAVDRLWFRSSAHDGRPTTHNPLKDWKAQQHRREVETHETVLLPVPPPPRSLSSVLNGDEKLWQWESWEEIERDPDKTEKRQTVVKPADEGTMETRDN